VSVEHIGESVGGLFAPGGQVVAPIAPAMGPRTWFRFGGVGRPSWNQLRTQSGRVRPTIGSGPRTHWEMRLPCHIVNGSRHPITRCGFCSRTGQFGVELRTEHGAGEIRIVLEEAPQQDQAIFS
jgi:hypothetical protein